LEHDLVRFDFLVGFTRAKNGRGQGQEAKENGAAQFHFLSDLCWISSIILATASLTLRTSSTVGALPAGKETSFSMSPSCALTSLTSWSSRMSCETSSSLRRMSATNAGWRRTLAAFSL